MSSGRRPSATRDRGDTRVESVLAGPLGSRDLPLSNIKEALSNVLRKSATGDTPFRQSTNKHVEAHYLSTYVGARDPPQRVTRPSYRAHIACATATDSSPATAVRPREYETPELLCTDVCCIRSAVHVSNPLAEVLRAPLQHLGTPPHQSTMRRWRGPPSARPHQPSDPRLPAGARG